MSGEGWGEGGDDDVQFAGKAEHLSEAIIMINDSGTPKPLMAWRSWPSGFFFYFLFLLERDDCCNV